MGKICHGIKTELRNGEGLILDDAIGMLDLATPEFILVFFGYHMLNIWTNMFHFFSSWRQIWTDFSATATLWALSMCFHRPVPWRKQGSQRQPEFAEVWKKIHPASPIPPSTPSFTSETLPPKLRWCRRTRNICKASLPRPAETLHWQLKFSDNKQH